MQNFLEIVSLIILGVFLSLLCYLIVEYISKLPTQRMEQDITPPTRRQPNEERIRRIDHLFDVGLVLASVLFGAELQYVSVKTQFQEEAVRNMADINFTFRVFSILLVLLILLWIIRELIPHTRLRILVRNFCWGFLNMIFAFEFLSFVVLTTFTSLDQLFSITASLFLFALVFTVAIDCTYSELGSGTVHYPSRIRTLVIVGAESIIHVCISYFILIGVFLLSIALGP